MGGIEKKKMYSLAHKISIVVFFVALLPSGVSAANRPDDLLIVTNKSVATDSISLGDTKAIFLKMRKSWRHGGKVVAIHSSKSSVKKVFLARVMGMTPKEDVAYWQKQKVVSGEIAPPEFSNTLRAVYKIKNALSYCLRKDYTEGVVKILAVVPSPAGEKSSSLYPTRPQSKIASAEATIFSRAHHKLLSFLSAPSFLANDFRSLLFARRNRLY